MVVTWNPDKKSNNVTLSNENLTAAGINQVNPVVSTEPKTKGAWYCEIKIVSMNNLQIGVGASSIVLGNIGSLSTFFNYYGTPTSGSKINKGIVTPYGVGYTTGDVIGILVNFDKGELTFYKNGVSQGLAFDTLRETLSDFIIVISSGTQAQTQTVTANFGATPFDFPPNQKDLPTGTYSYDGSQQLSPINKTVIKDSEAYKTYVQGNPAVLGENIIPSMINDTTPSPYVASASSSYGAYSPFNAFNRLFNGTSRWISATAPPHWCQIDLNTPKKAYSYRLSAGHLDQQTASWILQASNDNSQWTDLHAVTKKPLAVDTWTDFPIPVPDAYRYYRVYITEVYSSGVPTATVCSLSGFALQTEYIPAGVSRWDNISSTLPTEQQFRDRGMDSLDILNRKVMTLSPKTMSNESQILLEGQGQVFGYTIDLKKIIDIRKITAKGVE